MSSSRPVIAIVTGSTGTIGGEIVRGLVAQGYQVVLPIRDVAKGQALIDKLSPAIRAPGSIVLEQVNLDSRKSINALGQRLLNKYPEIDVLVNNAAVSSTTRQLSEDGIELTFAVNVLAYHWLSQLLRPALAAASKNGRHARIVTVASSYAGDLDLDDVELSKRTYEPHLSYKQNKQANRLLSWETARQYQKDGILVNAVYPGFTASDLSGNLGMASIAPDTAEESAAGPIKLAVDPSLDSVTGAWFEKTELAKCQWADDIESQKRLWNIVEKY